VGSDVQLNITNPDAADEFHIHGIELEQSVDAGVTATFNFVADTAGTFEVESHETEDVLVIIEVG
jgi:heme/copper-type cytochrome/quinol oxidase subunit 2